MVSNVSKHHFTSILQCYKMLPKLQTKREEGGGGGVQGEGSDRPRLASKETLALKTPKWMTEYSDINILNCFHFSKVAYRVNS